jgi:hypothetical protein
MYNCKIKGIYRTKLSKLKKQRLIKFYEQRRWGQWGYRKLKRGRDIYLMLKQKLLEQKLLEQKLLEQKLLEQKLLDQKL